MDRNKYLHKPLDNMRKNIKRWWISTFKIITEQEAIDMGLSWKRNIYGDEINWVSSSKEICRSIWQDDKYTYRVNSLKK